MPGPIERLEDLELSFLPGDVLRNRIWRRCMQLAMNSRSENQRYGALLLLGGEVIGEGWNRLLGRNEPFPFKTTFFLHAERSAIGSALEKIDAKSLEGATVYVAGFLPRERRPLVRKMSMIHTGACAQCARLYMRFGLKVAYMAADGWMRKDARTALADAQNNEQAIRKAGISKKEFRKAMCL